MPRKFPVNIGDRHHMLEVVADLGVVHREGVKKARRALLVRCDCGTTKEIPAPMFTRTKSCGCLRKYPHSGKYRAVDYPYESRSLEAAIHRCHCPTAKSFSYYGARGVYVCEEWREHGVGFSKFLEHIGERPEPKELYSLDRIDPDGPYAPGNVRWATRQEQTRNRRTTVLMTAFGETLTAAEWADRLGVSITELFYVRKLNVDFEEYIILYT